MTNATERVVTEQVSQTYGYFYTSFEMCNGGGSFDRKYVNRERRGAGTEEALTDLGKAGREFVIALFKVRGITKIMISPYQLSVQITPAIEWSEVFNDVISLTENHFSCRVEVIRR